MKVKVKIEVEMRKERRKADVSIVSSISFMSQESSIMQRQRTQVSCGDMFALLNQNHG